MKVGLTSTILYGRIKLLGFYFCFLAGVIFSLIVIFICSTTTFITLFSPCHVLKLHQPYLLHLSITYHKAFYNPPPEML